MSRNIGATPILRRYVGSVPALRRYIGAQLVYSAAAAGTPSAPGLTTSELSATSVKAAWTAPASDGGSAVTQYRIGWTEIGGQNREWSSLYLAGASPLTLVNLAAETDYDIYAEAINANGTGARTTVRIRTLAVPASTGSALPARVVQGYFPGWVNVRLRDIHSNYNLVMWSFAIGTSTDPGAVKMWFHNSTNNDANTIEDVAALKAAGKQVILSIGGWTDLGPGGFGYQLKTIAHVDRFMATVTPLIDRYGFGGIDWDLEHPANHTASAMIDASRRLKAAYGPEFIVGCAPYGYANPPNGEDVAMTDLYRDVALALGDDLDLMSFQLYNNGTNTVDNVKAWAASYITECGLRDDQWAFGWTTRDPSDPGKGAVTPEFCNDVWDSWRAGGREARGAMLWSIGHDYDDSPSYRWALTAGGHVLSTPAPAPATVPGTPVLASPATLITSSGFTDSWTAAADATDYVVERRPVGGTFAVVGTVTGTTYSHTGLSGGTGYEVQVTARNGSTLGAPSNIVSTTTAAATVLYEQPWDGTNGSGIAGWRARSIAGVTRATNLVLDTTRDGGGGVTPGSLRWTVGTDGDSGVELAGTVAVTPGMPVTYPARMFNGDAVTRGCYIAAYQFDSAGQFLSGSEVLSPTVFVAPGAWGDLTVSLTAAATATQIRFGGDFLDSAAGATHNIDNVLVSSHAGTGRLTRSGTQLVLDGRPYRFAGVNCYHLALNDNVRNADGTPTYPSSATVDATLDAAVAMGATMVRVHTLGISVGRPKTMMPVIGGALDATAMAAADYVIKAAKDRGLLLSVPLVDRWNFYHGGALTFIQNRGFTEIWRFWSEAVIHADHNDYVTKLLDHVNPLTGLRWGDDPTLAIWEVANEFYDLANEPSSRQRHADIAALITSLAPQALVMDGTSASGMAVANAPGLNDPNVDIMGTHYYDDHRRDLTWLASDAASAAGADKAYIIGEYDWTEGENGGTTKTGGATMSAWHDAILSDSRVAGSLMWSLFTSSDVGDHNDGYQLVVPGQNATQTAGHTALSAHAAAINP